MWSHALSIVERREIQRYRGDVFDPRFFLVLGHPVVKAKYLEVLIWHVHVFDQELGVHSVGFRSEHVKCGLQAFHGERMAVGDGVVDVIDQLLLVNLRGL